MQEMTGRYFIAIIIGMALVSVFCILLSDTLPLPVDSYAFQRFLQVIIMGSALIGAVLVFVFDVRIRFRDLIWDLAPATFVAFLFVVLALGAVHSAYVWVEPGMYALYLLGVVCSGLVLANKGLAWGYSKILVYIFGAGCFSYAAMSINVYLFALFDDVSNVSKFIPWGFVNIRYWSHIATWFLPLIPIAVIVGPGQRNRLWQIIIAIGAGVWWWILFLSSSRGSVLAIIFGGIIGSVIFGRHFLSWLKVSIRYFLIGVGLWLMLTLTIPAFFENEIQLRDFRTDSSGRLVLFAEAIDMSLENFPFGMGPQSWLTHEIYNEAYANGRRFGHPHNMYLLWAAEYGWLIIVSIALLVLQAVFSLFGRRKDLLACGNREGMIILASFTASVSAALFHAGMSAVFIAPGSMLVGMFVLTGFFALIHKPVFEKDRNYIGSANLRFRRIWGGTLAGLILVLWLFWLNEVWEYYLDMKSDQLQYHQTVGEGTLPRFWLHGNFPR